MKKRIFVLLLILVCIFAVAQEIINQYYVYNMHVEQSFRQNEELLMEVESFKLYADSGSLMHDIDIQLFILKRNQTESMPSNMCNTTGNLADGYRLLPNGEHFSSPAMITLPYDFHKIPVGYTEEDVYSYFYDTEVGHWTQLERMSVDTINHTVTSYTTHFTDFANAVIKTPEMPESKAFVPTAMTDLPDVNPLQGIPMIAAPQANNRGTVELTYPIELPKGRRGLQPNVDLHYSSTGGNGILGVGWNIQTPAITIDTRWGVPRYSLSDETEAYLLNGEQILMHDENGDPIELPHQRTSFASRQYGTIRFYARNTKNQDYIVRIGNTPQDYVWKVTDRSGTTYYYGCDPNNDNIIETAILRDKNRNIAEWSLTAVVDVYGNYIRYNYFKEYSDSIGLDLEKYLSGIEYTGNLRTNLAPTYFVNLQYKDGNRLDEIIDGRLGLLRVTNKLLCQIDVEFMDENIASYLFQYDECNSSTLYKSRLNSITKYDASDDVSCVSERNRSKQWVAYDSQQKEKVERHHQKRFNSNPPSRRDVVEGCQTLFKYYDASSNEDLFLHSSSIKTIPDLGRNVNISAGGGVAITCGWAGPTTQGTIGGNADLRYGAGFVRSMLIDMNGDGLPDYLEDTKEGVYYRKQLLDSTFAEPVLVEGLSRLIHDYSFSYGAGFQMSLGVGLNASPTSFSNSFTDCYFADINNDNLPDLITDDAIFVNYLDESNNPSFTTVRYGEDTIRVSNNSCGKSIYRNGEVDTRLECQVTKKVVREYKWSDLFLKQEFVYDEKEENKKKEPIKEDDSVDEWKGLTIEQIAGQLRTASGDYVIKAERNDTYDDQVLPINKPIKLCDDVYSDLTREKSVRYPNLEDVLMEAEENGYFVEYSAWGLTTYELVADCAHSDSLPHVDIVRVWVASEHDIITLEDTIVLTEENNEKMLSRYADGVEYSIQLCSGVSVSGTNLVGSERLITTGSIEASDHTPRTSSMNIEVNAGDILMFRLMARDNRSLDNTIWKHRISCNNKMFSSDEDFFCWPEGNFVAYQSGRADISVDAKNLSTSSLTIYINKKTDAGSEVLDSLFITPQQSLSFNAGTLVETNDSIWVSVRYQNGEPQWSKVQIYPTLRYTLNQYSDTIVYHLGSSIINGPSHISINNYSKYKDLFGVLHKGWGQFAYNDINHDSIIQLSSLSNYFNDVLTIVSNPQSINTDLSNLNNSMTNAGNGETAWSDVENMDTWETLDQVNPLADDKYWVAMTADQQAHIWVAMGNLGTLSATEHSLTPLVIQPDSNIINEGIVEVRSSDSAIPLGYEGLKHLRKSTFSWTPYVSVSLKPIGGNSESSTTEEGWKISGNVHASGGETSVLNDFMDMNGDGFPDNIGAKNNDNLKVQYSTPWGGLGELKCFNLKNFISSNYALGAGASGSYSKVLQQTGNNPKSNRTYTLFEAGEEACVSMVNTTYMDVNADGLPDLLHQIDSTVQYNLGYSFTTEKYKIPQMHINTAINEHGLMGDMIDDVVKEDYVGLVKSELNNVNFGISIEQKSISAGVSTGYSQNSTTFRMLDVNGDGYQDLVKISADGNLCFLLNENNKHMGNATIIRKAPKSSSTYSFTINASFTIPCTFVDVNPQVSIPASLSLTDMEWIDINGDGFVDLLVRGTDVIYAYYNANGNRPINHLKKVVNPTGQSLNFEYSKSKPTTQHPGCSWQLATVRDSLPRGYEVDERVEMCRFFSYEDAFYDRYEKSDYGYRVVTTSEYETATSRHAYRVFNQEYANTFFVNHGKLLQDSLSSDRKPYVVNKYKSKYSSSDLCEDLRLHQLADEQHTYYYMGENQPRIITASKLEYDQLHNLVARHDSGDVKFIDDDIHQSITYLGNPRCNMISLPTDERVYDSNGQVLRHSSVIYNNFGAPISVTQNNGVPSVSDLRYDIYGNVIEMLSPQNNNRERYKLNYAYDGITESYPVFVCNQFGETQLTKYDYKFGIPLLTIDPTGNAIRYKYDPMGRLIDVIAPGDNEMAPTVHYSYVLPFHNVSVTVPRADYSFPYVTKMMDVGLSGAEATLYDARGTDLQKKVLQSVGDTNVWVVQSVTEMDKFGRVVGVTTPFVTNMPVANYDSTWQSTSATMTRMKYDIMDRKRGMIHPDGHEQKYDYDFAYDYQNILRFRQTVKNENGVSSISLQSPQGWNIQQINPMGQDTKFLYNALGELLASTDTEGYTTQYQYDMLGRMTERSHPDAGRTQWSYDAMGNMVAMNTEALRQAGQGIKYIYSYNRLVEVNYPIHNDLNMKYKYYSNGRLAQREDACGTEDFAYDELGNVKQSDRWIYVPSENKAFLFVHRYKYDSFGRIQSIVYPDNDSVTYHYCESGQLDYVNHTYQGVTSPIIKSYEYDEAGRKTRIVYGNNVLSDFQYSQDRNWLKWTATFSPTTNSMLQDLSYQYDAIGNITIITQSAGQTNRLGGNYKNHYVYDDLNRLVDSYSQGGTFDYDFHITMSPTGRIGSKFLNTPSGNVLSDQTHGYDIRHTAHQPRVVFDAARGHQSLFWDANGNLSQSVDCNTGGAQLNFWDEENHLRMTINPKYAGYYGYDASGERVYKLTGHTQYDDMNGSNPLFGIIFDRITVYPSPYIVLSGKQYTKHFYAGTEKIATLIGDGGLLQKEGGLEPEHIGRLKEGFFQSFHIDPSPFNYTKNVDIQDKAIDEVQYQCKYIEQVDIKLNSIYPMLEPMVDYWKNVYGNNNDIFYTHSNHLGSASWITDKNGKPIQHIHYAPYGELIANQRPYGYDERFKFTGKERDEESGYDFFGARYYDHRKGFWNSVDPLADKYLNVTPYLYCNANPVMLVDPDGKDVTICGANKSSLTLMTSLVDISFDISNFGIDFGGNFSCEVTLDEVCMALDIGGLLDPTPTCDLASATLQYDSGDYKGAVISAVSVIPGLDIAKVLKGKKYAKVFEGLFKKIHGNSKCSEAAQHLYEIYEKVSGRVVKTGISGGKVNKNGKSYRAQSQVNKLNKKNGFEKYDSRIVDEVPAGPGARDKILRKEKENADRLRTELDPDIHKRP